MVWTVIVKVEEWEKKPSGIQPQMAQRRVSTLKAPSQLTSLSLSISLFFVAVAASFLAAAASAAAGAIFATTLLHWGQTQQFAASVRGRVHCSVPFVLQLFF